ncbi:MAG: ABC transporter ATP-binding protein [Eubacteriales bacterium]
MIIATKIKKNFDQVTAVEDLSLTIQDKQVFGLIGTNGAGKSTVIRMLTGVIRPDGGTITVEGEDVFNNPNAKKNFFYISDEQHFFPNSRPTDMCQYYGDLYPDFQQEKFYDYLSKFDLPKDRKIRTFSKGMKKQLSIILGISAGTKYIFCDETFDGLDPVMRQGVKSIFSLEMEERGLTLIIASHNLREVEDICEHIGLLYKGGMLVSNHLDSLKLGIYKIQCIFPEIPDFSSLNVVNSQNRGSLYTLTIRGEIEEINQKLEALSPVFYEALPLTLEEIFITETEAKGYDLKKLIQ